MAVCPSCRSPVTGARRSCPHCAMPLDQAERSSVRPQPVDMSIPDLDLDLNPPAPKLPSLAPPPPSAPVPPAPAPARPQRPLPPTNAIGAVSPAFDPFEDDDLLGETPHLEVATVAEKRPPVSLSGMRRAVSPVADGVAPRAASGVVPIEEQPIEVDRFEALALADFGPAPKHVWETPGYALRVFLRRRQLTAEHRNLLREVEAKEKAWLDSMVALVAAIRPTLAQHPDGQRWLGPLFETEERARVRNKALESASTEFAAKVAEIDREIAAAEEAYDREVAALEPITEELERRKSELSRAEAMLKRTDIEIRAAQQAAIAAAGPNATVAPPEHAQKLASLNEERRLRAEDVAKARADVEEVRRPHQAQEKKIADKRRQIADLRKRRKNLEEAYERQLSIRGQGIAEAEREVREITIELAKRLLVESPVPLDDKAKNAVASAHKALVATRHEAEKHAVARDLYEPAPYKQGWTIIGAGLLVLVLLVVWASLAGGEPPEY